MTNTAAAATVADLIGIPFSEYSASGVEVVITLWHNHANVTCWSGAQRHEDWTANFPHRRGYEEAKRALAAFQKWNSPTGVAARAEELRRLLRDQDGRPARMRDLASIREWETELTSLESFADRELQERFRRDAALRIAEAA